MEDSLYIRVRQNNMLDMMLFYACSGVITSFSPLQACTLVFTRASHGDPVSLHGFHLSWMNTGKEIFNLFKPARRLVLIMIELVGFLDD